MLVVKRTAQFQWAVIATSNHVSLLPAADADAEAATSDRLHACDTRCKRERTNTHAQSYAYLDGEGVVKTLKCIKGFSIK